MLNYRKILNTFFTIHCFFLAHADYKKEFENFNTFYAYCITHLPTLKQLCNTQSINLSRQSFYNYNDYHFYRAVTPILFEQTLEKYFEIVQKSNLMQQEAWLDRMPHYNEQLLVCKDTLFEPYAQKIIFPVDDCIAIKGDLHGDIHSLLDFLRYLQNAGYTSKDDGFRIIDPLFKIMFLGDYVDRGIYGVEVLYTLMRLKIENPEQVILIRGNHEDISLNNKCGFMREYKNKFQDATSANIKSILEKLKKFYELLPVVVYIGSVENETLSHFAQCCHGGIEIGFNPQKLLESSSEKQYQLIGHLIQKTLCKKLKSFLPNLEEDISYMRLYGEAYDYTPISPTNNNEHLNGFMWNDFQHDPQAHLQVKNVRGIRYNKSITEAFFQLASTTTKKLHAIIRAHQHTLHDKNPMTLQMVNNNGLARLWNDNADLQFNPWHAMVCTLLLSPDGKPAFTTKVFRGFQFDTTLFITFKPQYEAWEMNIVNNNIYDVLNALPNYQQNINRRIYYNKIKNKFSELTPYIFSLSLGIFLYGVYKYRNAIQSKFSRLIPENLP